MCVLMDHIVIALLSAEIYISYLHIYIFISIPVTG